MGDGVIGRRRTKREGNGSHQGPRRRGSRLVRGSMCFEASSVVRGTEGTQATLWREMFLRKGEPTGSGREAT